MAAEETLSYYIRAYDLATPVFRAFGAEVEAATRGAQGSVARMNATMAAQSEQSAKLVTSADRYQSSARGMQREAVATGSALGGVRTRTAEATTEIEKHKNAIEQAGYGLAGFANQLGPLGRSLDVSARHAQLFRSQGIDYLAAGLVGAGASLIAFGTKANITFDNISKQMEQQAGTSKRVTAQLLADVKQVSTQTPASYQAIATAVTAQYRLFHSSNQQIKENTDLFISFAEASGRQVQPAIASLSNIMRQFHPAGMGVVDVMDQMVNLSQKTQQPLSEYLNIVDRFGPVLRGMGLSFTQIIGLFKAFADHGVSATMMSRGLFSAMSNAEQQIKAATRAQQDGGASLIKYRDAVDSAQMRVNELNTKLVEGKGNQRQLNDELLIARDHLTLAQQKLEAYTLAVHGNGVAHLTVASIIGGEMKAIEGANTKAESLNLATKAFGSRLGPQMADALWHNKQGLDAMDAALGNAHDATKKLADASSNTLHGQMAILSHDFSLLASNLGLSSDGLKGIVKDVASVVHAIDQIPKPVLQLLTYGGMGLGAATLLARHTPLGGAAARALPGGAPDWLRTFLTAKSPTGQAIAGVAGGGSGGLYGIRGAAFVGTMANPIGVAMIANQAPGGGITSPAAASQAAVSEEEKLARTESGLARTESGLLIPASAVRPPVVVAGGNAANFRNVTAVEEAAVPAGMLATVRGAITTGFSSLLHGGLVLGGGLILTQLASGAVGGSGGRTINQLGTGATIGATAGSFLGPGGAAAGAVAGTGAAAAGMAAQPLQRFENDLGTVGGSGLKALISSIPILGSFFSSTPVMATNTAAAINKFGDRLKDMGDSSHLSGLQLAQLEARAVTLGALPDTTAKQREGLQKFESQITGIAKSDPTAVGMDVAKKLEAGWNQFKFQSEPIMFKQLKSTMAKMPPAAQASAAESAIAFASKLEAEGKLGKHSADNMLAQIEIAFPGLTAYMGKSAKEAAAAFTTNLDLKKAEQNIKDTLGKVRGDFPEVVAAMDATKGSIEAKTGAVIRALEAIHPTSAAQAKLIAQDLAHVRSTFEVTGADAGKSLGTINTAAEASAKLIPKVLGKGSQAAEQALAQSFSQAVKDVQVSMARGVTSTSAGIAEINKLMAQALGALGVHVTAQDVKTIGLTDAQALLGYAQTGATNTSAPGAHFSGGKVTTPMYRVGEEAPAHPEYVLATNPAYRQRNLGLWAQAGRELDVPGFRTGGIGGPVASGAPSTSYVFPFPKSEGFTWERIDQGQDLLGPPGGPVLAIGPGNVSARADAFSGFGPFYPILDLSAGPWAGRSVYYGHAKTTHTGAVGTGEIIGVTQTSADEWTAAPAGWLEFGFTTALGAGIHGQGAEVAPMLHALAAGHMVTGTGGPGGAAWKNIKVPKWTGPGGEIGAMGKAILRKVTAAANAFGQAKAASMGGAAGFGGVAGPVVTASWFDDPQTKSGHVHVPGFAELSNPPGSLNFSALGNLPMGEVIEVGFGGRKISIPKVDVGAGGAGLGGHIRAIDLTKEAGAQLPGFLSAGLTNVSWRDTHRKAFAQGGVFGIPGFCEGGAMGGGASGTRPHFPFPQLTPRSYDQPLSKARDAAAQYWGAGALPSGIQVMFDDPTGAGVDYGGVKAGTPWGWVNHGSNVVHINEGIWGSPSQQAADFPDFCGLMVHEYGHLAGHWDSASTPPTSITYPIIGPQNRAVAPCVQHYKDFRGKPMKHAGAFGGGGMVTANEPTTAVFGDKGAETAIFIPHHQMGGTYDSGMVQPGTYPTSPASHHHHTHHHKGAATHYTTSLNPLTDKVETHSSHDWQLIHAEAAKERHDASVAKKAYDAWLAQQVTDMLKVGGVGAGDIQLTRKQANVAHLPLGHPFQLLGRDVNALSDAGFKRVQSGLGHQLGVNTLDQTMHLAAAMNAGIGHGADRGLFHQQGALEGELKKLNTKFAAAEHQRDTLWAKAQTEHGKRLQQTWDHIDQVSLHATLIHQKIDALKPELAKVGGKIADSRAAQLENQVISAAAKGIASAFSNQTAQFSSRMDTIKLLSTLAPGTNMHLTNLQRQSLGLTKSGIHSLEGAGPAGVAAQIDELTKKEIPQYQSDARRLQALYHDALKTHNKKLQDALLKQIGDVTKATTQAYADLQAARQAKVDAIVTKAQTTAAKSQTSADLATSIESLSPGASTGLSAAALKALGVNPLAFAGGASYLATKGKTGGMLTAGDIAVAKNEGQAIAQPLAAEKATDLGAINKLTAMLPGVKDAAERQHILDQIGTLSGSVVSLTDQIAKATDVTQQEIDAINAQVSAAQATAATQQSGADIITQISNLAPGTDVSGLGITPAMLQALGIDPSQVAAMEGGGATAIGAAQSAQGGTLTPAQIAAARAATGAENTSLGAQRTTDQGLLGTLEGELPNLSGDAATQAQTQINDLIQKILGLTQTMSDNTAATSKLTQATNANTSSNTGQQTGTVGFSYQGQNYVAGGDMTSDDPAVVTLGI